MCRCFSFFFFYYCYCWHVFFCLSSSLSVIVEEEELLAELGLHGLLSIGGIDNAIIKIMSSAMKIVSKIRGSIIFFMLCVFWGSMSVFAF